MLSRQLGCNPANPLNKCLQLCYQYYALNMKRVVQIDVSGPFFYISVRGNMSMVFGLILKNRRSREHIE